MMPEMLKNKIKHGQTTERTVMSASSDMNSPELECRGHGWVWGILLDW
jgi:hypothetical protein